MARGTYYIDGGRPAPGAIDLTVRNLREVSPTLYFNVPRGFDRLLPALEQDAELRSSFFRELDILFYAAAALPDALWRRLETASQQARGDTRSRARATRPLLPPATRLPSRRQRVADPFAHGRVGEHLDRGRLVGKPGRGPARRQVGENQQADGVAIVPGHHGVLHQRIPGSHAAHSPRPHRHPGARRQFEVLGQAPIENHAFLGAVRIFEPAGVAHGKKAVTVDRPGAHPWAPASQKPGVTFGPFSQRAGCGALRPAAVRRIASPAG